MERRTLLGAAAATPLAAMPAAKPAPAAEPASAAAPTSAASAAPAKKRTGPLRVQIVMFDGAEEQDYTGPYEVFALCGRISQGAVQVSYVTGTEPRVVTASWGTKIDVPNGWSPADADLLVVPGGGFGRPAEPGIWAEINSGVLPRRLAAAAADGKLVTSLCTGGIILAAAGLVTGRPCTTHRQARDEMTRRGGNVINARVVDDGDLVTAAGVTSGLELALHLVRREVGAAVAVRAEEILEYEARGTVWAR